LILSLLCTHCLLQVSLQSTTLSQCVTHSLLTVEHRTVQPSSFPPATSARSSRSSLEAGTRIRVIRGQRVEYIPRLWFPSALLRASIFRRIGRVVQGVLGELAVLVCG